MFSETLAKYGELKALGTKRQGQWHYISYSQYYLLCRKAARGFLKVRACLASSASIICVPHIACV